jgi:peptidoglycan glycosyltransferase
VLLARTADIQIFRSESLKNHESNKRGYIEAVNAPRGRILSADGYVLAITEEQEGEKIRIYPYGSLFAHTVGYFSKQFGLFGAEKSFNEILTGSSGKELFAEARKKPQDIVLSLDLNLQKKAAQLLRRKGAVAAVNVRTGEILCMYSYPSFDPNRLDREFEKLKSSRDFPLINRAAQGVYAPGSTLKILTLASYIENGGSLDDVIEAPSELKVGGFRITNYGKRSYGKLSVKKAFSLSVNTVFAQLGLKVGVGNFRNYALRVGLGKETGIELPESGGSISENLEDPVVLAWSAVGQAEMSLTPLQVLMLVQTVANDGVSVQPTIFKGKTTKSRRVFSEKTSGEVKAAMLEVVEAGTGRSASIRGIKVAGKTGTAEVTNGEPHAWFVGFAPYENPEIAAVVIVENGVTGGSTAAPIFRELLQTYFYGR